MMHNAAPTRVRHRVIGVCSLMGVLLYLDRFCVSFAEAYIKEDLARWTKVVKDAGIKTE